jgi:hypothetical protein
MKMIALRRHGNLATAALLAAAQVAWAQDVPDEPYRFLENLAAPESKAFYAGEYAKARAALDALPGRA